MEYFIPSLIAGIITVASPCTITLLPVILSGSLSESSKRRAILIVSSLGVSVVVFGLLLKATTLLIDIPQQTWNIISGMVLVLLGLILVFPHTWDLISAKLGFSTSASESLGRASLRPGDLGAVLTGFALGPVFSSCSPVYLFVLSTVIRESFVIGLVNLVLFAIGLMLALGSISIIGQKAVDKFKLLANPKGPFRKGLGVIIVVLGILIIFGLDKEIQVFLVERGLNVSELELIFLP